MIPSTDDTIPEDAIGAELDEEISSLQSQISSLKAQRTLQATTILSSHKTQSILTGLRQQKQPTSTSSKTLSSVLTDNDPLVIASASQIKHSQENLYRACASITTFLIRDPDPNAVDNGHVLGLRIDVSSIGKFVRPYYIMLNKPFIGSEALRIHKHTVPPCIPLDALATRYLPVPKGEEGTMKGKKQDLRRFIRGLRREVVGYHNRISTIKNLRKEFKLDEKVSRKGKGREKVIEDISAADAEAKQVRIEWVDGKIGRVVVGEKGEVKKCVVIGEDGRDRETERRVCGGGMVGIGERLKQGIY